MILFFWALNDCPDVSASACLFSCISVAADSKIALNRRAEYKKIVYTFARIIAFKLGIGMKHMRKKYPTKSNETEENNERQQQTAALFSAG